MNLSIKQRIKYLGGLSLIVVYLLLPFSVSAATVSLSPLSTQVNTGDSFTISIDVNTQGVAINNAEAVVTFPANLLQVVSVSSGGSIFSIWVTSPTFSNSDGTISFNGGQPNPGYTGSSGHIISVQFKAVAPGDAQISFSSAAVRANDGLGTDVFSGKSNAAISITQKNSLNNTITIPHTAGATPPATTTPNQVPVAGIVINSSTQPDGSNWYNQSTASFTWTLPTGTTAVETSLDHNEGTTPIILRRSALNNLTIDNIPDGIWYFNVRALVNNNWSKVASKKIQIDMTPPDNLVINDSTQNSPATITAHDELSGISSFMVQIDGAAAVRVTPTGNITPLDISGVNPGTHNVKVVAYDLAGNSVSASASVKFRYSQATQITNYSRYITEGQRISANGIAPQGASVNIHLLTQDGLERIYNIPQSNNGTFSFQSEPIAEIGNYQMWAQVLMPDGSLSAISAHIPISVKLSITGRVGSMFKTATHLLNVSNVIILLLLILCIVGWMNYFKIKKSVAIQTVKKTTKSILNKLK